jgi:hypothetical protein
MNSNYKTFTFLTNDSFVVGGLQAGLEDELPLPAVGLSASIPLKFELQLGQKTFFFFFLFFLPFKGLNLTLDCCNFELGTDLLLYPNNYQNRN